MKPAGSQRKAVVLVTAAALVVCPLSWSAWFGWPAYAKADSRQAQFTFVPQLTPLAIPTLSAQPFIQPLTDDELPFAEETQAPLFPGQPGFNTDDAEGWIVAIESRWTNINVITCSGLELVPDCAPWQAEEAQLLYETMTAFTLTQYLDGQLQVIRTHEADWAGLLDIFDSLFRKPEYFQGTIAHELTHAATRFHPELLDWWEEAKSNADLDLKPGDWRLGWMYDWSYYDDYKDDPILYDELVEGELFAMAIAALMYDPWWNQGTR